MQYSQKIVLAMRRQQLAKLVDADQESRAVPVVDDKHVSHSQRRGEGDGEGEGGLDEGQKDEVDEGGSG